MITIQDFNSRPEIFDVTMKYTCIHESSQEKHAIVHCYCFKFKIELFSQNPYLRASTNSLSVSKLNT